jgi:hypothetical protein
MNSFKELQEAIVKDEILNTPKKGELENEDIVTIETKR